MGTLPNFRQYVLHTFSQIYISCFVGVQGSQGNL